MSCIPADVSCAILMVQDVSVKAVPETVVLQRPEEDVSRLLNVPAEQLLLRWVAHHIGAAGAAWEAWLPLKDMGPDLADCTALGCLLAQLEPQTASVIDFRCGAPLLACTPLKVLPPVMHRQEPIT